MNLAPCFTAFTLSSGACSSTATGNNGSVTGIANSVDTNETQAFTYDNLNRIQTGETKSTSGSDCWGLNFTGGIDAVANLTTVGAVSGYTCTQSSLSVTTDGYNHLVATGYSYDHAGNMTGDGNYTYSFDGENRITQASGMSNGPYCYVYDGNGFRVEKFHANGGTCASPTNKVVDTLYWRMLSGAALAETDGSGTTQEEYVFFAGQRIAQVNSSGSVYYYYSDQLGSTVAMADGSGNSCYQATFTPYGIEYATQTTCSSHYKFTGYERDTETGLDYAYARYYSSRLGRFMSADPMGLGSANATDPQSLNAYAYVRNTPTSLIDPLGLDWEQACVSTDGPDGPVKTCEWQYYPDPVWIQNTTGIQGGGGGGGSGSSTGTAGPTAPHSPPPQVHDKFMQDNNDCLNYAESVTGPIKPSPLDLALDVAGGVIFTILTDGAGAPVLAKFGAGAAFTSTFTAGGKMAIGSSYYQACMVGKGDFTAAASVVQ